MTQPAPSLRAIAGPLFGLVAIAILAGIAWRDMATPPDESEIIDRAAMRYQQETGGALTDCHATPSDVEGVRLYVFCGPASGDRRVYLLDDWGGPVDYPALIETLTSEDRT